MIRTRFAALLSVLSLSLAGSTALAGSAESVSHVNAAHIANGLSLATMVKVQVAQHYMMMGEFPSSNRELGIGTPKSLGDGALRSIEVARGGAIVLTYGPETGADGGQIRLMPKDERARLTWKCSTRDYPGLQKLMPQCTSGAPASRR